MYMDAAAPSEAMIMIDVQGRDRKCCTGRRRHYVDGKPRPLFRGVLHGLLSVALAIAAVLSTSIWNLPAFSLAFAGKFVTYAASATFHLYPFSSVSAVTKAFVADLICVPFSACAAVVPFLQAADVAREALFAGTVLLFNAVAVLWQTHNQIGLKTRDDRSDAPRCVATAIYIIWVFTYTGIVVDFNALWGATLGFSLVAAALSTPVTKAHAIEPIVYWVPWHARGVWSLHEDFHLVLALSDACWLVMALHHHEVITHLPFTICTPFTECLPALVTVAGNDESELRH